jgi:hypothetical protein
MRSINVKAVSRLDFDHVIQTLAVRFPGTVILQRDWYAATFLECMQTADRLGWSVDAAPVQAVLNAWAEYGVQRSFQVPLCDGVTLYARLSRAGGYFFCYESEFTEGQAAPLTAILSSFDVVIEPSADRNR